MLDETIKWLEEQIAQNRDVRGELDPIKLAAIISSYKDLCVARLVEELREGKLEVRYDSLPGKWYLKRRS